MEKRFFLVLFALLTLTVQAQLHVDEQGRVAIKTLSDTVLSDLTIGYEGTANYHVAVQSKGRTMLIRNIPCEGNFGENGLSSIALKIEGSMGNVLGDCGVDSRVVGENPFMTGGNYGLRGTAGNSRGGNYGVAGFIEGEAGGAAIYGGPVGERSLPSNNYSAYFHGNTATTGLINGILVSNSDERYKENVVQLAEEMKGSGILDQLSLLSPIAYDYKAAQVLSDIPQTDGIPVYAEGPTKVVTSHRHFGLVAQQLKEVFPNLVYEKEDGGLAVNYVELVPVLLQAVKELKEEINRLGGEDISRKSPSNVATASKESFSTSNELFQNKPNPFTGQTEIRFTLADGVQNAQICIFDMNGKSVMQIPVTKGMSSVLLNGYDLNAGMYLYSLVVNGQEIQTRRMIVSK